MARRRIALHLVLAAVLALLPIRALAHGGHTGPMQTFTQAIGPYELAITVEIPAVTPAPLYLDIMPQTDIAGATLVFRAAPRGQSLDNAPVAQVQGLPGPQGIYYAQLDVDRAGDWILDVRVTGPQGSGFAQIPFTIPPPTLPAYTIPLLASLGGLVVLMITSIGLAIVFNRLGRAPPRWANWLLGQGMFACLIVAAIFGIQQIGAQIQQAQAATSAQPAGYGLPHANMTLATDPALPQAGRPLTLTLDLSDGATGLPVDDLTTHHEALMHLVVIDESGAFFAHLHPPRLAPGRYAIAFTPDRPGRYTAYAEIARQDSGTQVIARSFEVGGAEVAPAPPAPGLGPRQVAGMQVEVSATPLPLRAGKQATFTFSFTVGGQPVQDIAPWLGMAGHLIARSADGAIFGHIHAAAPMAPAGVAGTGMRYGPDIRFAYTFPQPGRYQLWGQFKYDGTIVTVPVVVEVE